MELPKQSFVELPSDPQEGDVYRAPDGSSVGGSVIIGVYKSGALVGYANQLAPMPNVSRKYLLSRLSAGRILNKGDVIDVRTTQHLYTSIIFHDGWGWIGDKQQDQGVILSEDMFRVVAAHSAGPFNNNIRLYENVCLELITKGNRK